MLDGHGTKIGTEHKREVEDGTFIVTNDAAFQSHPISRSVRGSFPSVRQPMAMRLCLPAGISLQHNHSNVLEQK